MNRIVALFFVVAAGILPAVSVLAQPHRPAPGPPAAPAPKKPDPHGLTLLLGPAVYYYQGDPNSAIERFNESRIGYQVNGMLGYKGPEHRGGNTLGVFGTAGYTTESVFNYIKEYQGLTTDDLVINKYFTFYQVEAGFIISNILRFSTGAGKQNFTTINGEESFRYLTSTIGLMINLGPVLWNIDANFNYGRDWPETALRISTGLLVKF